MKTQYLLLMLFLPVITILGCEKDNDDPVPSENTLNGVWIEGSWQTMTTQGVDTTYTYDEYVGDGYNNGVTTVNVQGSSFVVGDIVLVDGVQYSIYEFTPDGSGLDDNYRYHIETQIVLPFEGCKYYLELFKRQND